MSVEQYQRQVNSFDKEISELEKKKASKDKEVADLDSKIQSIRKSITKHTSESMLKSKMSQIDTHQKNTTRKAAESADLGKKIADKRKKRSEAYLRLQKEQQSEQKKIDISNRKLQSSYESQIRELRQQVASSILSPVQNISQDEDEYDVFISHAWEDKEDFVEEFVAELEKLDIRVWYDKKRISLGDSMREKIEEGLRKSHFGIVVLSPSYIADGKYWTKSELNGLFQKENIGGKVLIPIWHKLTKKDVMNYSLILADRLAMNTASYSPEEIAVEIKEMIDKSEEKDNGQA